MPKQAGSDILGLSAHASEGTECLMYSCPGSSELSEGTLATILELLQALLGRLKTTAVSLLWFLQAPSAFADLARDSI